jgi:hypothetical protein
MLRLQSGRVGGTDSTTGKRVEQASVTPGSGAVLKRTPGPRSPLEKEVLSNEKQCKLDLAVTAALAKEKDPPRVDACDQHSYVTRRAHRMTRSPARLAGRRRQRLLEVVPWWACLGQPQAAAEVG